MKENEIVKEFDQWLNEMVMRLIDDDNLLDFEFGSTGTYDAGWRQEESQFCPDGGCGPWPSTTTLYKLSEQLKRKEPAKSLRFRHIANATVEQHYKWLKTELAVILQSEELEAVIEQLENIPEELEQVLNKLESGTIKAFLELVAKMQEGKAECCGNMGPWTGIPVLIEAAANYSGKDRNLAEQAEKIMKSICTIACQIILSYAEDGNLDDLEILLRQYAGIGVVMAGAQVGRYSILLGRAVNNSIYSDMGVAVVDAVQQWDWESDSTKEPKSFTYNNYVLPQLLEALGYAYEEEQKEEFKDRMSETINNMTENGQWNGLVVQEENGRETVMGVYAVWDQDKMKLWTSEQYLYLNAMTQWYKILRNSTSEEDRQRAELYKERFIYLLRFLKYFHLNPTRLILDHDLSLHRNSESKPVTYSAPDEERNVQYFAPFGCIQCGFAVILDYLNMEQYTR